MSDSEDYYQTPPSHELSSEPNGISTNHNARSSSFLPLNGVLSKSARRRFSNSTEKLRSQVSKSSLTRALFDVSSEIVNEVTSSGSSLFNAASKKIGTTLNAGATFLANEFDSEYYDNPIKEVYDDTERLIDLSKPETFPLGRMKRPFNVERNSLYFTHEDEPPEEVGKWSSWQIDKSKFQYTENSKLFLKTPLAIPEQLRGADCICGRERMVHISDTDGGDRDSIDYLNYRRYFYSYLTSDGTYRYGRMEHTPGELNGYLLESLCKKDSEGTTTNSRTGDDGDFELPGTGTAGQGNMIVKDGFEVVPSQGTKYQKQKQTEYQDQQDSNGGSTENANDYTQNIHKFVGDLEKASELSIGSSKKKKSTSSIRSRGGEKTDITPTPTPSVKGTSRLATRSRRKFRPSGEDTGEEEEEKEEQFDEPAWVSGQGKDFLRCR